MLPIVDKPLIQYAVEEAVAAGIEEFIFVTGRNKTAIEDHFDHSTELETTLVARGKLEALNLVQGMIHSPGSVSYVRQQEAAGLGHAIWCARHQIASEPVAILLADDLILGAPALREMVDAYIIEPGVFEKLAEGNKGAGGEIQLTDSLAARIPDVPFMGLRFSGERFDCGSKLGFLKANIAFARSRPELATELDKWLTDTVLNRG